MPWVLERVWKRLNDRLFLLLGPERYARWVRHVRPATFDEEVFTFHVEGSFARGRVEALFLETATEAARRATNRRVRVRFAVEPESFPLPHGSVLGESAPVPAASSFGSFVQGSGNRLALGAARAFAAGRPGGARTLLLHGPSGLGKTHLLGAIEEELGRRPGTIFLHFTADRFRRHCAWARQRNQEDAFLNKCRNLDALLFDDVHRLSGWTEAQEALAGVLRAVEARHGRAALTCERPPRLLEGLSGALRSLLRAETEVAIHRPDEATSAAFLASRAPPGTPRPVLETIACNVGSSHKDQLYCLAKILELGAPSAATARSVVTEFLNAWSRGLTYADIVRAAAGSFGVKLGEIYSDDRSGPAADARQACYYLARKLLKHPFAQIGEHFGRSDHATVLHACAKLRRNRGAARVRLERLERELSGERRP